MQLFLNADECARLEGVCLATTNPKQGRRALEMVNLAFTTEGNDLTIVATATDSYRAARVFIFKPGEAIVLDDVQVQATKLKGILSKVRGKNGRAILEFSNELRVTTMGNTDDTIAILPFTNTTPPGALDKMFKEARDTSSTDDSSDRGYNPVYLSQVAATLGQQKSSLPMRVKLNGPDKPAYFRFVEDHRVIGESILMPVRL